MLVDDGRIMVDDGKDYVFCHWSALSLVRSHICVQYRCSHARAWQSSKMEAPNLEKQKHVIVAVSLPPRKSMAEQRDERVEFNNMSEDEPNQQHYYNL